MACANGPFSLSLAHSLEPAVQENGDDAGEGREAEPGSPRRCDIIVISGRKEKCEAAKEALEVRGQPGRGVASVMLPGGHFSPEP